MAFRDLEIDFDKELRACIESPRRSSRPNDSDNEGSDEEENDLLSKVIKLRPLGEIIGVSPLNTQNDDCDFFLESTIVDFGEDLHYLRTPTVVIDQFTELDIVEIAKNSLLNPNPKHTEEVENVITENDYEDDFDTEELNFIETHGSLYLYSELLKLESTFESSSENELNTPSMNDFSEYLPTHSIDCLLQIVAEEKVRGSVLTSKSSHLLTLEPPIVSPQISPLIQNEVLEYGDCYESDCDESFDHVNESYSYQHFIAASEQNVPSVQVTESQMFQIGEKVRCYDITYDTYKYGFLPRKTNILRIDFF